METTERLTGFMSPTYISDKAKEFFNEADFGEFQENMTERSGLSTLANLFVLLYVYFIENGGVFNMEGGGKMFKVPPLVMRYFNQEIGGKSYLTYREIVELAVKMRDLRMRDQRLDKARPLLLKEQALLKVARAKYNF